ncbi:MAG: winged helix-turn-helix domain-containing protein [Leptolyngbya sp. Prado105]|nr:winged helix-turn-helix domain-containing protein [Leptolyngbya sp. Prado105]
MQAFQQQSYGASRAIVEFRSRQSYYDLMARAGLSWNKSQSANPKYNKAAVEAKKSKLSVSYDCLSQSPVETVSESTLAALLGWGKVSSL